MFGICTRFTREDVEFLVSADANRASNDDIIFFFLHFLHLAITDRVQDTDDTDDYVVGEIDEYELDYTSSSEDLFSNGSSSGTDVIKFEKKKNNFQRSKNK